MLRYLYYSLPVGFRYLLRRAYYFPADIFKKRNELIPPSGLIYTGGGDFERQGKDWMGFFINHCNLKETDNFLDIGSGIGRIAIPLVNFLKGEYHGFDAVKLGVDWCNDKISSKYKNFHFRYVDLFNDLYKNKGIDATTYQFPYPQNYFNVACAISVFTHMLPDEVINYLKETNDVLADDGFFIATFFILDDESIKLMNKNDGFKFQYTYGNYALIDKKVKSANVAFDKKYLFAIIEKAGFVLEKSFNGYWCGREKSTSVDFQDILILKKKKR
jgi:SAM-dependent methyltransferase